MLRTARQAWHGVVDGLNSLRSEWVEYERPIMVEPLEPRVLMAGQGWDVVLIDRTLPHSDLLMRAVLAGARVMTYDGHRDSADTVIDRVVSLADSSGWRIESLSILAHGRPGQFMLGNQWISSQAIAQDAAGWEKLGAALAPHGTIRLYGCNVADGFSGSAILNRLATVTGAEVFASNNITGRGGDWTLEASSAGAAPDLPRASAAPFNTRILVRYPDQLAGTLSASVNTATGNLSAAGTTDWVYWRTAVPSGTDRKATGGNLISSYSAIGTGVSSYTDDPRALNWNDGAPDTSFAETPGSGSGLYISGIQNGFSIRVPADTALRALTVYVGGLNSAGTFTAHLSDRSAADYTDTTPAATGQYDRSYTIAYSANSPGQTLTITWTMASGAGNVALSAAALGLAPTIVTPAAASPATVNGTAAALSVQGSDDGGDTLLSYNWSVLSKPSGAADPTYSANGTYAARNTTATFYKAGNYTLVVTLTDAGGLSTTSTVGLTVQQTFTQIAVTNLLPALADNTAHTFTATAEDQFGAPMPTQPAFSWSVDGGGLGGTIDPVSGLYTAPGGGTGADTIRAASGGISGTAVVTVTSDGIFTGGADIGYPGHAGTFSFDSSSGAYTLQGGGYDIWNNWDAFYYASRAISGDVTIVARVTSVDWSNWWSKAGVMVRATSAGDSPFVMVSVNPTNGVEMQWRTTAGGYADWTGNRVDDWGAIKWVKLVRTGDTFSGYYSSDGATWTVLGTINVSMPAASAAGLMVTAHDDSMLNQATFDNVSITDPVRVAAPAASAANNFTQSTTGLSVLGATDAGESTLNYAWSVLNKPAGALDPTFSINGTNAAKNTIATFYASGNYTFHVLITDGVHSTSSDVGVTVAATYTGMVLTPAAATVVPTANSFQFTLTMYDQFNSAVAVLPPLNWSASGANNSISSTGLFTAGATPGVFDVTVNGNGYTQSATITVQPALQGWWKFDENGGLSASDSSGGNNTGVLVNGPVWAAGQFGSALSFDPTLSQYVQVPDAPGLDPAGGVTVSAWIDATDWNGNRRIVQKGYSDNQYRLLAEGGLLEFDVANVGAVTATLPAVGAWHQVVGTYNGSMLALYVDGVLVASAAAQGAIAATTDPLVIGAKNIDALAPGDCFSGSIDDVRVYGRGLSQGEVAALFSNAGALPTVVTAAAASPASISGKTSSLSVLGDSSAGENTLIYAWAATALPAGAAQPVFSPNSTNAAKAATVTFFKAGNYTLTCTIVDANGNFVLSSVNVTVQQVLSGLAIHHSNWTIPAGIVYPLQAVTVDQFGDPMTAQSGVTWTVQPGGAGGTVDPVGLYTAPASGGTDVITAVWAGYSATTTLTSVGTATINYSTGLVPGNLTLNGGATVANGALVITDDNWGEARSAFQTVPVDVRLFTTAFAFQITDPGADGFTFCLQSNSPAALGGSGGALGFVGITHSIAVKFDLWDNAGEGSNSTGLFTDGTLPTLPAVDLTPSGIDLHSGHVFNVLMTYDGATLLVQISDTTTGASATQSYAIDIPGALGSDVAYAGFTGGTGGLYATQRVLHWEYVNQINADPPTIAVGPAATVDPLTQTTAALTVLGADSAGENTLTYKWSVVAKPAGAADPIIGANGSNASKNSTVQFFAAGAYSFLVSVSDGLLTTLGAVDVTVQQLLSGIQIIQGPQVALAGASYQLAVSGIDQFGQPTVAPPAVVWSVDPGPASGTIDATGFLTILPNAEGVATIRAQSGAIAAVLQVLVSAMGIFTASQDIGGPDMTGFLRFDSSSATYTISGGGWDIWNNSDQFHFVSAPISGDAALVAQVTTLERTDDWAKAGVMIRASADPDSMFVDMLVTPTNVSLQWRNATGGLADTFTVWGPTAPKWVKLMRIGDRFTGWYSDDGIAWNQCGNAVLVPLPSGALAGLAVTSHNGALLTTAKFQNVILVQAPTISTPTASTALISGTGTNIQVLGADPLGEGNLVYSWATVSKPIGAPDPVFQLNGTYAAKSSTVALLHAGVYVFQATATNAYGLSATSLVSVRAVQTVSRINLSPPASAVQAGGMQQFAAVAIDQFGIPLVAQPRFNWWVDTGGPGTVNGNGLFTAAGVTGSAMVHASTDGLAAASRVAVFIVNAPPPAPGTGDSGGHTPKPVEVPLVGVAPLPLSIDHEVAPPAINNADAELPLRPAVVSGSPAAEAINGALSGDTIQSRLVQALDRSPFGSQRVQDGLMSALRRDLTQYTRLRPDAAALRLGSEAMLDATRAQIASEMSVYTVLGGSATFRHAIDAVLQQAEAHGITASMVSKVAATTTVAFSAGYLLWCLQGGTLFMSMLTSVPFWTWFDPLPVLDSWDQVRSGLSARGGKHRRKGRDDDADMNWLMGDLPGS